MKRAVIISTGSYLPENHVHNENLDQFPKTSKFIISQKTGVFSRRSASEEECTSDLAIKAGRRCIEKAGISPEEIEGIVVSTSSPDRMQPATATRVQHGLGACHAFAFDINSVCSGSTYGIALANSFIRSGQCSNILFIASEVYSKILNKKDFGTYPFFGDGAGAVFFKSSDSKSSEPDHADPDHADPDQSSLSQPDSGRGILCSCLRTDGSGSNTICVPGGGTMMPFEKMKNPNLAYFKMKGKDVFKFAVEKGAEIITQIIEESDISLDRIKCFICHQANINIIHTIAEKLDVSTDLFFINLFRYGNTASASVLIALDEAICSEFVKKNDLAITVAFGGGLSWGANLIRI
ncbi:beta-ketoacyl-ACP synthase 3 [Desulfobacterales bacterium HSG16]|nr:beta-ketoacyl-ACP synthase 3 [Desulfobacterales bacterium HSG16]